MINTHCIRIVLALILNFGFFCVYNNVMLSFVFLHNIYIYNHYFLKYIKSIIETIIIGPWLVLLSGLSAGL